MVELETIKRASNVDPNSEEPFRIAKHLSKTAIQVLKGYYCQYVTECQQMGFIPCTLSTFIVDNAIEGYLHAKEKRRFLKNG